MSFKNVYRFLAIVLLAGCVLPSCKSGGGSNKIDLKLNLPAGSAFLYTTLANQDISTAGMKMHQDMTMDIKYEMLSDSEDLKKLQVTYDHIGMKMTTPMGDMTFDSRDSVAATGPMNNLNKLIDKSFVIYLDKEGRLRKMEGLSSMLDSLDVKGLSDSSIASMMQRSFDFYPGHPIAVGDTWQTQSELPMANFKFQLNNTYTLKSVENDIATVLVSSAMKIPGTEMEQNGMKMNISMDGKQSGAMEISVPTGQVLSGKIQQTIDGNMEAQGQKIPMSINGTINISSKKL